jgi:hypothetical protein
MLSLILTIIYSGFKFKMQMYLYLQSIFTGSEESGRLNEFHTMESSMKEGTWFYTHAMRHDNLPKRNIFVFMDVVGGTKVLSISTG